MYMYMYIVLGNLLQIARRY